ncbi:trehalose-6-phosphate synthase [Gryllotalpicola sp.]|uniref:alpha,alpha-trehalose-phosphate synthase (UDP-forming) n=1 Tax=Gryllotalpicola sp. TaxID=1932787 RepID=UPI00261CCBF5|nr:trehalose-6-phosphate synthase [Gryllotalpicola sp.]
MRPAYDLVVVSNRLPVDYQPGAADSEQWRPSPGGLVTALEPVLRERGGVWVGWPGVADLEVGPFEIDGMPLIPVPLSEQDVERYYEGMANGTLWPLYHDVIVSPEYHRQWWEAYLEVNRRFAEAALAVAAPGATVWVHDYQLQLVPRMLRDARPDLVIGFFNHIPFPAHGLFSQLPWRRQIVEGLLGADVVGFQRTADASNFRRAVQRLTHLRIRGDLIELPQEGREVLARPFPISIDAGAYQELAKRPDIWARAKEIRRELGDPKVVLLGVDRLDYTKGILHRLKAFGELLEDGDLDVADVALVQIAAPSRERVESYKHLREEVEMMVSRVNGDFSSLGRPPITYLHQGYPRDEMVAFYLAADVMLVTALRDGMNLVAKEYVASRVDLHGALVLSEFAGASDELRQAVLVNPHDIDGLKAGILQAARMPPGEQARRMKAMRRRVISHDVQRWSATFLGALSGENRGDG